MGPSLDEDNPVRPTPARAGRLIARWDLDKTYLRTEFDTLGDLVRTALERPDQKRAVPGAAILVRELANSGARIHILSGSPRQMRPRLEEKLRIDRIPFEELTLKPNLSNILRLRFRALRDQLGYKLPTLLAARNRAQSVDDPQDPSREVLVGDDAEADAFVYSLYADLCDGVVDEAGLRKILRMGQVYGDQRSRCLKLLEHLKRGPVVERILIHLDRQTPPSRFDSFGPRVVPFYNYLQAAFVLCEDGRLTPAAVLRIAQTFAVTHRFDVDALARSYRDLMRRGHAAGSLPATLRSAAEADPNAKLEPVVAQMVDTLHEFLRSPPTPTEKSSGQLDYVRMASQHRGGRNRVKFRGFSIR